MAAEAAQTTGVAAGVPFVAVPPTAAAGQSAPVVVAWHLMDAPRTEAALAAALPLDGLDAWRIYLGLPLCGSRTPGGGAEQVLRLGYEDAVMNLYGPISDQAVREFGPALAELRGRLDLGDGPLAVVGGSHGAAVAQLVTVECDVDVAAAVLVSPVVQLRPLVEAVGRRFGVTYPWSEPSLQVARRLDFVARAAETADRGQPAVLLVVGADDDEIAVLEPAARLHEELQSRYDDPGRVAREVVPGMAHALAEEPGVEPAPQTEHAATVDAHAVRWLRRHLVSSS